MISNLTKTHGLLSSLLIFLCLSSLSHDYNNKTLQPIMHNTVNYPPNVISKWMTILLTSQMPYNPLEYKTILTALSFHLSLTKFYLSTTLTHFSHLSLVSELHHSPFPHFHWSLRFMAHYRFTATNYHFRNS